MRGAWSTAHVRRPAGASLYAHAEVELERPPADGGVALCPAATRAHRTAARTGRCPVSVENDSNVNVTVNVNVTATATFTSLSTRDVARVHDGARRSCNSGTPDPARYVARFCSLLCEVPSAAPRVADATGTRGTRENPGCCLVVASRPRSRRLLARLDRPLPPLVMRRLPNVPLVLLPAPARFSLLFWGAYLRPTWTCPCPSPSRGTRPRRWPTGLLREVRVRDLHEPVRSIRVVLWILMRLRLAGQQNRHASMHGAMMQMMHPARHSTPLSFVRSQRVLEAALVHRLHSRRWRPRRAASVRSSARLVCPLPRAQHRRSRCRTPSLTKACSRDVITFVVAQRVQRRMALVPSMTASLANCARAFCTPCASA